MEVGSNVGGPCNFLLIDCHSQHHHKNIADLRQQLTCSFCEEILRNPYTCVLKRLPTSATLIMYFDRLVRCGHTLCLICIAANLDSESWHAGPPRLRCPTCGTRITVRPRRNRGAEANVFWLHGAEGQRVSIHICQWSLDVLDEHFPRRR
jgi:DNA-directed RNA polymerase subunit RPC12/RpoP